MFYSAYVLVNGHPVADAFAVERALVEVRAGVSGKYQEDSTKVSIVSVSRLASAPHFGQVVE
jgi:hypothetical protein